MMACGLSKSLTLSSSLKKQQQGIVTILGDISSNTSSAPSLKRAFSTDLSSKNWLLHNGFSPMKRISSSEKLRSFTTDDEEEPRSGDDIWAQIQQDNNNNNDDEIEKPRLGQTDVWSSILTEKKTESIDPPYVHPLMKRASSLSEKSLNICTESLGSETGCESFSSYASSEIEDTEIENQEEINLIQVEEITEAEVEIEHKSSINVPNHTIESFPPPIRSLSTQSGGSLHMKTRRDNGRLVLKAVSMPSHNNFSAKRQNGRLLLTFLDEPNNEIDIGDETDSEVEEEEDEFANKPNGPIGPITFHRLAHKPIEIPKTNTTWPATDDEYDTKTNRSTPLVQSLPPRPRVAKPKSPSTVDDTVGAACFNTYNYFWKPNNTEAFGPNTKARQDSWINGCKERRRSLLSVEPHCIAT